MTIKALYAGTFDPITNGHLDIISRSLTICDELIIAVGVNPAKNTFFEESERLELIKQALYKTFVPAIRNKITEVVSFQGLLVEYAKQANVNVLIRGIRSVSDFEYEINLANVNKELAPEIETSFLPTNPKLAVVSSSMVKEVAKYGGKINKFVPTCVEVAINKKFGFIKYVDPVK